jgi:hypothetical protein
MTNVIEIEGLRKSYRRADGVHRRRRRAGPDRPDGRCLRLSRPERLGKDDDHPLPVRPRPAHDG